MTPEEEKAELYTQYAANLHAIQSGVMHEHSLGSEDGSPKHLRVGVNSAMCSNSALVKLLIKNGIIDELEYARELVDETRREVERYEMILSEKYKCVIKLG
jgi:hypothetical protein